MTNPQENQPEIVMSPSSTRAYDHVQAQQQYNSENYQPRNQPPVIHRNGPPERGNRQDNNYRTNPREKRNESKPTIDPNGTFFVTEGNSQGGMRMNWEGWTYIRTNGVVTGVSIKFPSGTFVKLIGKDAYNFLKIVGDRNAELFARPVEPRVLN